MKFRAQTRKCFSPFQSEEVCWIAFHILEVYKNCRWNGHENILFSCFDVAHLLFVLGKIRAHFDCSKRKRQETLSGESFGQKALYLGNQFTLGVFPSSHRSKRHRNDSWPANTMAKRLSSTFLDITHPGPSWQWMSTIIDLPWRWQRSSEYCDRTSVPEYPNKSRVQLLSGDVVIPRYVLHSEINETKVRLPCNGSYPNARKNNRSSWMHPT